MIRRLLALNHFANSMDAPGGTRLVELTSRLDGWDTTIVAADRNLFTQRLQPPSTPEFRTVRTPRYPGNGAARIFNWLWYAIGAFVLGLRLQRPDVVYASSPHLLTGLAGLGVARLRGASFVLEVRDLWPQILFDMGRLDPRSALGRLVKTLELSLYRRADAIIVLTHGVGLAIVDEGIPAERIHFIPNGAEPADFVTTASRDELRARYGFTGVTIVYAGAHGPANGLDFVLDAAAELAVDTPEALFVLVGDGLDKVALVDRARREGLDNVTFLSPVPKTEIPDLLSAADAGLHVLADLPLFLYGVSPNKLFDYLAAGLPVLTNTAGEIGELVKDFEVGVVVGPAELASGVRELVAAGETRRRSWGANGRTFMAEHRSRALLSGQLQVLLDGLTGHRRVS